MLAITVRDLRFRRGRVLVAIGGAGLAFAVLLISLGISAGLRGEARATVAAADADAWVMPAGVKGPFSSATSLPAGTAARLRAMPGVQRAAPLVVSSALAVVEGERRAVNVLGVVPRRLGAPATDGGVALGDRGEAVVGDGLGVAPGSDATIAGSSFRVVGQVRDRSYEGGVPVVYVPLADAQELAFDGRALASAILVDGDAGRLGPGLGAVPADGVVDDLLSRVESARTALDVLRIAIAVLGAAIVGAVAYASARARAGDFALLKALGGDWRRIFAGLVVEAALAAMAAAMVACALALAVRPLLSLPVSLGADAYLTLVAVAAVSGLLASLMALRGIVRADPAIAFSG